MDILWGPVSSVFHTLPHLKLPHSSQEGKSPPHTGSEDEIPQIRNADLGLKVWLALLYPLFPWEHWEWPRWDVVLVGAGSRDSLQVRKRDKQHLSSETPSLKETGGGRLLSARLCRLKRGTGTPT